MRLFTKIRKVVTKQKRPSIPFPEWNGLFCLLSDRLTPLHRDSEEKFLSIGSCLQDFTVRSRGLSEMSMSASSLTSGDEIGASINGLRVQLDKMTQYLDASEKESHNSIKKLQHILGIVEGFDRICDGFTQIAHTLQFLSISILAESARLGNKEAGFGIFSDSVKKLAKLINAKSIDILHNSQSLTALVNDALSRTRELLNLQHGSAVNMLRSAQTSLESLTGLNNKSADVSKRIAARSSEIYQNIGEVVTSMQFHDITRQEMEHVGKALEDIRERLDGVVQSNGRISDDRQREYAGWIGEVSENQMTQLLRTKCELVDAVDCAIENLRRISGNVKTMVGETQELSGSTHQSGSSLMSQVEDGITAVIQSLGENARRSREISASVGSAVNGMTEFAKEIEEISEEIKLIAFNAMVKAKHTGQEGATLGVLADGIQRLAVDARSHTAVVLEKLRAIACEVEVFHASADDSGTEAGGMVKTFEGLLSSLHRINAEFANLLSRITENGRALGDEIELLANQTMFHKETAWTIDNITEGLNEIVNHSRSIAPFPMEYSECNNPEIPTYSCAADREQEEEQLEKSQVTTGVKMDNGTHVKDDNNKFGDGVELF